MSKEKTQEPNLIEDEKAADTEVLENGEKLEEEANIGEEAASEEEPGKKKKRRKEKKPKKEKTPEELEEERKRKEKAAKQKPKDIKKATSRLISYLADQKKMMALVAFLVVGTTILSCIGALLMKPVYDILEQVVKTGTPNADEAFAQILKWLLIMSTIYIVSAAFSFLYTRIMLSVSLKTVAKMRRELFAHLQTLPLSYFDKRKTGEIMSHFTSDVSKINDLVSNSFPTIISSIISAVMTIVIMIVYSWKITLTITVAIALMVLVVLFITSKCSPLFKKQQKAIAKCNGYVEEYIRGLKAVKVFCYEEKSKQCFAELNENYRKTGVKANIIGGFMGPLMSMITRVNYAVAVSFGAHLVIKGEITIPKLITYLNYAKSYGSPILSIAGCYSSLISALAGAERIFAVLDTDSETDEGKITLVKTVKNIMGYDEEAEDGILSWKVPDENGNAEFVPVKCDIDIKNITFSYVEGTPVLKNLTVHANSGEKLAFVGSTGAGKTTITNLINRFYEVDEGEITIDGLPIRDIKKSDLRNSMAFVLQDTNLFVGTIADNIRYGRLDATDEEVVAAAKLSNAHSFIEKLPDGYESEIRADGVNLSAGQSQLINIARCAISDRPLLVLDEATSSVDTRTERLIELGMDKLMSDKTVLVIAHRLSTVRNSQDIVVLESGEIIEQGNHDELIALGKKYYQLYTGAFEMN